MFLFCSEKNARVNLVTTFPPGKSPSIGLWGQKFPKAVESRPLWHLGNIISVQDQILNCLGHWRGLEGTGSNKTKNCGGAEVQERRMKRMLFAGAMMLAATGSTLAADLPPSMPPPPPPRAPAAYVPIAPPMYNWGGIYIGINGGYAYGSSSQNWTSLVGASTGNFNIQGALAGGTLGANFQTGQFVFGIEGDGDWTNITGSTSSTNAICGSCTTSNNWLATLRARAGVAWDRVLIYATAGGAAGDIKSSVPAVGALTAGSSTSTEFGWTAGGGLEFGITDNLTAKLEYLYVDLQNGSFTCTVASCGAVGSVPVSFDASLVRAGLNLKFNPF
jgi:outer membrane immunogenic protein